MPTISNRVYQDIRPIGPDGSIIFADSTSYNKVSFQYLYNSDIRSNFTINSFATLTGIFLAGSNVNNPVFNASYPNTPSGAYIVSGTGVRTLTNPFTSHVWAGVFVSGIPNQTQSFTLYASGYVKAGISIAVTGFSWQQMQYWGVAQTTGSNLVTFIKTLSNSGYNTSHSMSGSFNVTANNYAWYAFRLGAGTPNFTDSSNDIVGGFQLISSGISFTNAAGYTETYSLYRSDFDSLGQININIS